MASSPRPSAFGRGLVHISSLVDDYYWFDEAGHTLEETDQALPPRRPRPGRGGAVDVQRRMLDLRLADLDTARGGSSELRSRREIAGSPGGDRRDDDGGDHLPCLATRVVSPTSIRFDLRMPCPTNFEAAPILHLQERFSA